MDLTIRDQFINNWKKYFNNSDLPIVFYYSNNPQNAEIVAAAGRWSCLICELQKVRSGKSLAFSSESIKCSGAKRYLGFSREMRPNFNYFLSCGIENEMEGERYIKTPELVDDWINHQARIDIPGNYIVFKRWDMLTAEDEPDVAIFFADPDVLSSLFTLANYDQPRPDSTFTPFGAGCGSIIHYPYVEKDAEHPRAVIGLFDVSARKCITKDVLSFSVPMIKFEKMISYMDESFLITESWRKIQKRII
jgi:hypothetical protein